MFVGCDTDQLRESARVLNNAVEQMQAMTERIASMAEGLDWIGRDADVFRSQVRIVATNSGGLLNRNLGEGALLLAYHADAQECVSAALDSPGSSGGPGIGRGDDFSFAGWLGDLASSAGLLVEATGLEDGAGFSRLSGAGVTLAGVSLGLQILSQNGLISEGVRKALEGGSQLAGAASGGIQVAQGINQFSNGAAAISKVGGAFAILGGGLGLYQDFQSFRDGVQATEVVSAVSNTAKIVGGVMMFTPLAPVGAIIVGAAAVVDAGVWVAENWDTVTNVASTVAEAVTDVVTDVVNDVADAATEVFDSVTSGISNAWGSLWD